MKTTPAMNFSKLSKAELRCLLDDGVLDPAVLHKLVGLDYDLDREIASRSDALPQTLQRLAEIGDDETVAALARNPICPPEILLRIAPRVPLDLFENPVLDLLLLEDPSFPKKLKPGVLRKLLANTDCPLHWLRWAAYYGTKGDQLEMLKRKDLEIELLRAIAVGPHTKPAERASNRLLELGEAVGPRTGAQS
jgi:hypothetical protein